MTQPPPSQPDRAIGEGVLTYGTLSQKNDAYDGELLTELEDLYKGGYTMRRKAAKYLPRLVGEHEDRQKERCRSVSYMPYFGQIVDQFTSDLFGQPLSIKAAADAKNPNTPGELPDKDFYTAFEKDADNKGKSFADLMQDTMRTALKKCCALICVDAPADTGLPAPINRAEEEARGTARLYAYEVPLEQLIDWETNDRGDFELMVLRRQESRRTSVRAARNIIHETFLVWSMENGVAVWQRYGIEYPKDKPPKDDTPVALEAEGTTTFKRIPVVRFDLPEGLWVGNKIGPLALEHFQRRSALVGAEYRSMVAIPFVKKGSELGMPGGALPSVTQTNPTRGSNPVGTVLNGKGWLEIGADDEVGYAEPHGKCYELVDKQVDGLREAMFHVNHQMAASIRPTGASMGRSGLSKQKDQDTTARVLHALGHEIRQFATKVYDTISEARDEDVHWTPHGLDAYDSEDREQVLEEAVSLDLVAIPSPTFRKVHKRVVAGKLLKGEVDPETMTTIYDEIDSGVDDEENIRQLKNDATVDALENPQPGVSVPGAPTMKPAVVAPGAKPPAAPKAPQKKSAA